MVTSSPDYVIYEDVAIPVHHHSQWLLPRLQREVIGVIVSLLGEARLIMGGCMWEGARSDGIGYYGYHIFYL